MSWIRAQLASFTATTTLGSLPPRHPHPPKEPRVCRDVYSIPHLSTDRLAKDECPSLSTSDMRWPMASPRSEELGGSRHCDRGDARADASEEADRSRDQRRRRRSAAMLWVSPSLSLRFPHRMMWDNVGRRMNAFRVVNARGFVFRDLPNSKCQSPSPHVNTNRHDGNEFSEKVSNRAIHKLSTCSLFHDLDAHLGSTRPNVYVFILLI